MHTTMNNPGRQATVVFIVLTLAQAPIIAQTGLFVAMGFAELQACGPDGCPTGRIIELDVDNIRVLADTPVPLATRNSWRQLQITADPLDKQIAATALMYGLTVVTRNVPHYEPTGVAVLHPFT